MNPRAVLSEQVAELEAERDQLLRARVTVLPEAAAREIYQRGYRAGYDTGRRTALKRGRYAKTKAVIGA